MSQVVPKKPIGICLDIYLEAESVSAIDNPVSYLRAVVIEFHQNNSRQRTYGSPNRDTFATDNKKQTTQQTII